jgi:hypothetical protein
VIVLEPVIPAFVTVMVVYPAGLTDVVVAGGGTAMITVAVPPETVAGFVIVLGAVIRLSVMVMVVVGPANTEGVGDPEETGTATMTVAVPPGVPGGCVIVLGLVRPAFVTVTVV